MTTAAAVRLPPPGGITVNKGVHVKNLWNRSLFTGLAIGALLLSGCAAGQSSAEPPTSPSSGSDDAGGGEPETTDLTFATFSTGIPSLAALVAVDEGYFEDEGLTVAVEKLESTPAVVPVLASSAAQFGYLGYSSAFDAVAAGVDLVNISGSNQMVEAGQQLWVRDDSPITSVEDMEGASVGVLAVGSFGDVLIGEALDEAGLSLDDVELKEVAFPNMAAALEAGDIDVGWLPSPFNASVAADPESPLRLLVDFQEVESLEDLPIGGIWALRAWAEENPNTVAAIRRALDAAGADLDDPDYNREKQAEYGGFPPEIAAQAPVSVYPGVVAAEDLRRYADLQSKHGLTTEIDVEELVLEP